MLYNYGLCGNNAPNFNFQLGGFGLLQGGLVRIVLDVGVVSQVHAVSRSVVMLHVETSEIIVVDEVTGEVVLIVEVEGLTADSYETPGFINLIEEVISH